MAIACPRFIDKSAKTSIFTLAIYHKFYSSCHRFVGVAPRNIGVGGGQFARCCLAKLRGAAQFSPKIFPAIFRKFSPPAARRRAALWAGKKIAGKKNSYAILCAVRPANCEALPAKLGGRPRKFGGVSPQPGGNNCKISDTNHTTLG
jgi:hypothetical protein